MLILDVLLIPMVAFLVLLHYYLEQCQNDLHQICGLVGISFHYFILINIQTFKLVQIVYFLHYFSNWLDFSLNFFNICYFSI